MNRLAARRRAGSFTSFAGAIAAWVAAVALLAAAPTTRAQWAGLPDSVAAALRQADLPDDSLAAVVVPLSWWAPHWAHQADRPMQPGSTMKLVTSVVALDRLGPNHRGFTELRSAAQQIGDVLQGDLVLRGGADPEFGLPQLWALLAEARWLGIREIAGDLIVDRNLFRPARTDVGLPPFDEAPEFAYNVVPDALNLAGNLLPLELSADAERLQVRSLPPLPELEFDASAVALTDQPCEHWDDDWRTPDVMARGATMHIALRGAFPKNCSRRVGLQLIDRLALTERLVRVVWQGLGGTWRGNAREAAASTAAPAAASAASPAALPVAAAAAPSPQSVPQSVPQSTSATRVLARREARPWGELLRPMNKQSDNALARLLFLSLGVAGMDGDARATTLELARGEVMRWFAEHRIDSAGLVLDNGSGLSRSERITPRQMASMLEAAQAGPMAPELMMSLPIAGVDGTLRRRLKNGAATGLARLKTGTLRDAIALAGYVPDAQGRLWVVAAMINHERAGQGRPALDALIEWVARAGVLDATRQRSDPIGANR